MLKQELLTIKEVFYNYLSDILLENGYEMYKDENDHILESIGQYYEIHDPLGFKYIEKYRNYSKTDFLNDLKAGVYDLPYTSGKLYEYVSMAEEPDDLGFEYTYPNRLLSWFNVNQFESMKNRLLHNHGSNRAVAVTIDPKEDHDKQDIPCLQFLQFIIRDNKLSVHCLFRSNDIYGAFYANMMLITYWALWMKDELNEAVGSPKFNFGGIYYHCTSGHIYWNDLKQARKLISTNLVDSSFQ